MTKKVEENIEKTEKVKTKIKKLTLKEYESKVLELAEKGLTAEKIGENLRKQGIHPKEYKTKISKILGDKYVNPDLKNIENKLKAVESHYEKHKQDKKAKRERERIFAKLRNLKLYFKIPIEKKK